MLYETAAICLHLVDTHPQAGLAPAPGTSQRAHFYKWLIWMTNSLQATMVPYFYPERSVDDGNEAGAGQVRSPRAGSHRCGLLSQLDAQLASHGQPWLLGADYSALDPYAFVLCRWTRGFKGPAPGRHASRAARALPAAHAGAAGGAAGAGRRRTRAALGVVGRRRPADRLRPAARRAAAPRIA